MRRILLLLAAAIAPHQTPDGFQNRYSGEFSDAGFWRWQWERTRDGLPLPPTEPLDPVQPDIAFVQQNRSDVAVTWIGHATVLLQIGGTNVLTDPVFSERASPVSFAGPRRHQRPGLALDQLPHIDIVLISHNHYDHLDLDSVRALQAQPGGSPHFFVPLGVEKWFASHVRGASVRAFDWDDVYKFGDLDIEFVAVQHWSGRTPWDRNQTLWGSWAVLHPTFRFWFSGDLGYSPDTAAIGERFGAFDLAAIAIGAYEPRWFMRPQHIDPAEAVKVRADVGACQALGVHWGTFALTDEPLDQPRRDLAMAREAAGLTADQFFTLQHGETWRGGRCKAG